MFLVIGRLIHRFLRYKNHNWCSSSRFCSDACLSTNTATKTLYCNSIHTNRPNGELYLKVALLGTTEEGKGFVAQGRKQEAVKLVPLYKNGGIFESVTEKKNELWLVIRNCDITC